MTRHFTDDDLKALGLDREALGEPEMLQLPDDSIMKASGAATALADAPGERYFALPGQAGRRSGLRLLASPRFIKIQTPDGASLDVRTRDRGMPAFLPDEDDPGTVYLPRLLPGAVAVLRPSGLGLLLDGSLQARRVTPRHARLPAMPSFESPVRRWASESGDAWVAALVESHLAVGDAWHDAVAAGACSRLREFPDPALRRRVVEAALRGTVDEIAAAPQRWAASLTTEQATALAELVSVESDMVHASLEDLDESLAYDDDGWNARLLDVLHRRDDIESVLHLLAQGHESTAGAVRDCVGVLDDAGDAFTAGLPRSVTFDDERLRRVARCAPAAWWTRALAPEE